MRKKYSITAVLMLFVLVLSLAGTSCNRSTCPTFDENAGKESLEGSKGKSKSSLFPKKMK